MASEVRVNKLTNRSGLGTATFNDDGSITVAGNLNLNNVTTTGRNAGVSTTVGALIYNTTTNSIEGYGPQGWISVKNLEKLSATGGTTDSSSRSGYKIHTFTSPGTFTVSTGIGPVEYLVIGAGGGGGSRLGGGGGAGALRYGTLDVSPGPYSVAIGGGGR